MAEADQGKGALGMLTKDQAFANKLNDTVSRIDNIMTGIDKGEGTAGLLVKDPALYHNLDKLAVDSQRPGEYDPKRSEEVPDDSLQGVLAVSGCFSSHTQQEAPDYGASCHFCAKFYTRHGLFRA